MSHKNHTWFMYLVWVIYLARKTYPTIRPSVHQSMRLFVTVFLMQGPLRSRPSCFWIRLDFDALVYFYEFSFYSPVPWGQCCLITALFSSPMIINIRRSFQLQEGDIVNLDISVYYKVERVNCLVHFTEVWSPRTPGDIICMNLSLLGVSWRSEWNDLCGWGGSEVQEGSDPGGHS